MISPPAGDSGSPPGDLCAGPTFYWWATRIEFALGVASLLFAIWVVLAFPEAPFGDRPSLHIFGVVIWGSVVSYVGLLAMLIGIGWMISIYRDLRSDSPTSWRYRDHR